MTVKQLFGRPMRLRIVFICFVLISLFTPGITMLIVFRFFPDAWTSADNSRDFFRYVKDLQEGEVSTVTEMEEAFSSRFPTIPYRLSSENGEEISRSADFITLAERKSGRGFFLNSQLFFTIDGTPYQLETSLDATSIKPLLGIEKSVRIVSLTIAILIIIGSLIFLRFLYRSFSGVNQITERIASGNFETPVISRREKLIPETYRALESMRLMLKQDAERYARLLLGISHDLKTPLTSIIGYASLLEGDEKLRNPGASKSLGIIRNKAELLHARILRLIDFIKMESGSGERHLKREVSLNDLLTEFCAEAKEESDLAGFSFTCKGVMKKEVRVMMEPELINRALENILHNVFQHGCREDCLEISLTEYDDKIELLFVNTGAALAEAERKRLFEPFARGDKSRNQRGFGLGLAIVASIFDTHGWKVSLTSDFVDSDGEKALYCCTVTIPIG